MNIIQCDQLSEAWFQARIAKITASDMPNVMAFLKRGDKKGGDTEARKAVKARMVSEILSGAADMDGYLSQCMKDGTEYEPKARTEYELRNGVVVQQVGFIVHPTINRSGASPDGLLAPAGGVELKCPKTKTHIGYMLAGVLPPEYEPQVMWNIACAEAEWWDFVSYGFDIPRRRFQLFQTRVYRDDKRIAEMEDGVRLILQEVDDIIGELERLYPELESEARAVADFTLPRTQDGGVDLSRLAAQLSGDIID